MAHEAHLLLDDDVAFFAHQCAAHPITRVVSYQSLLYYKKKTRMYICMYIMVKQTTLPLMNQLHILHKHHQISSKSSPNGPQVPPTFSYFAKRYPCSSNALLKFWKFSKFTRLFADPGTRAQIPKQSLFSTKYSQSCDKLLAWFANVHQLLTTVHQVAPTFSLLPFHSNLGKSITL